MPETSDLISRQAVIDLWKRYHPYIAVKANEFDRELRRLPSAQPEIIYCKDCKHFVRDDIEEQMPYGFYNTYFHAFCDKHWDKEQGEYIDVCLDDHCSFAERRTDEDD